MDLGDTGMIENEAGLIAALGKPAGEVPTEQNNGIIPPEDNTQVTGTNPTDDGGTGTSTGTGDEGGDGAGDGTPTDGDEGTKPVEDEGTEFSNAIEYLDSKFDLGLNLAAMPEDLDRAGEAEIIAELFTTITENTEKELAEYASVAQLLEDPEVAAFIQAKKSGASLRDIMQASIGSVDTMSNEEIISTKLKSEYPNMEDAEIESLINDYKEKGVLDKMADASRSRAVELAKQEEEQQAIADENAYKEDVQRLASMLDGTEAIYNVPITDEMKKTVFLAATQRDDTGMTQLDKALQSDEGVVLATLGVLYMETLMKAKASTDTNKRNKKLMDKLFENPANLQSGEQDAVNQPTFDPSIANRF